MTIKTSVWTEVHFNTAYIGDYWGSCCCLLLCNVCLFIVSLVLFCLCSKVEIVCCPV